MGTLEVAADWPPCSPILLHHLGHPPPATPLITGLLQFLTSSLHPARSPAQACLSPHLSPGLLSHCCLVFLLPAPGARGVSPPSLWPVLSSLSWALSACPGAAPGLGLPLSFRLLSQEGLKGRVNSWAGSINSLRYWDWVGRKQLLNDGRGSRGAHPEDPAARPSSGSGPADLWSPQGLRARGRVTRAW